MVFLLCTFIFAEIILLVMLPPLILLTDGIFLRVAT